MAVEKQPPDVLAMILADAVHRDLATGKNYIHGAFHGLVATSIPWTLASMVAYIVLTDGYGETLVKVRLVDAEEIRPPIFEAETVVNFPDPLTVMEVVFPQFNVVFPEEGEYRVLSLAPASSCASIGWMYFSLMTRSPLQIRRGGSVHEFNTKYAVNCRSGRPTSARDRR